MNDGRSWDADNKSKTPWIIGGVVLAVVIVIGVFVFASGSDDGGDTAAGNASQETATVAISGEDLPPLGGEGGLPSPDQDPAFGLAAPKLVGQSFDESEVVIDPSDGTPKAVVFLAHWCPHCQAEVPKIQNWIDEGDQPEGVEIVTVSTSVDESRPNYPPSAWLAGEDWEPPVMLDDQASSAFQTYGGAGFPFFVMIDADGNVFQRGSGELPEAEWDAAINAVAATGSGATS